MRSAPPDKSNLQAYANRPASLELPGSPFQRVTTLLDGIEPGLAEIDLGVGGPQHQMPAFVEPVLMQKTAEFRHYPPSKGTPEFLQSVRKWLDHRYALDGLVGEDAILPLNGSREGLFFALFEAKRRKPVEDPLVFSPNPFYQTYAAAAKAAGCRFLSPPDSAAEGMAAESLQGLPDFAALAPELLADTVAVYVASPTNPQGNSATLGYWQNLIELADRHDFMIFADECYSEIYRDSPPTGILEAARSAGSTDHVISFNSLSKRSNLPGLRVGFMAGDATFLTELAKFRNMAAPQVPMPLQAVAAAAFADETHVAENRRLYNAKFDMAQAALAPLLPLRIPDGGFFLWADCSAFMPGEAMALHLWKEAGLRVVPGAYLTADETDENGIAQNRSDGFIRIALVHDLATASEAINRLRHSLEQLPHISTRKSEQTSSGISRPQNEQTGKFHA
tara:strand:+ start:520 stop:1869 length:1350 start_codon:yes stop_codon:yes gene_type:complete